MILGIFVPKHNTRLPSNHCATGYHETESALSSIARGESTSTCASTGRYHAMSLETGSACACSDCAQHRRSCHLHPSF